VSDQTTTEALIQAASRVLRLLEITGSGKMADAPAAVALREAIEAAGGHYVTAAEEREADRRAIIEAISGDIPGAEPKQ
jgi:hypothetical protein